MEQKKNNYLNMGNLNRKLFFLTALPRSGNTLFGSLMNQNPDIAVTANSITLEIFKVLYELKDTDVFKNFPDHQSLDNVSDSVFNSYYKHWPQKYIIDRGPVMTPGNFMLMQKHFKYEFKVIVLWRDLMDVLASFIKWFENEPTAYPNEYGKTIEEKLLGLMNNGGTIARQLISIQNSFKYKHLCHYIKYDDLVTNPEQVISELYKFLDIPYFNHNFKSLKQFEVNGMAYNDNIVGNKMHTIKTEIKREENPYKQMIPKSIIDKYGHVKF